VEFQKVHLDFTTSYDEGGASTSLWSSNHLNAATHAEEAAFTPDTITSAQQHQFSNLGSASLPLSLTSPVSKVQLRLRALASFEVCLRVLLPMLIDKGSSKRSSISTP
jgi:hypothetical protein